MPVLFAAFTNPLLLWGLAGASVPLLIHLLNRRKFREESWAAMRFLLAAMRKNQKRIQIEHWLLLLVRTLLLACLALAMARPALEALGALDSLGGRRHWLLAIDGSMSMEFENGESTRFDQARTVARRLIQDARPGDAFSLVLLADPPRTVIGAPAFAKDAVLSALDSQTVPQGGMDLAGSFQAIDAALETSDITRKEIVFLTDLQSEGWKPAGASQEEQLRSIAERWEAKRAHSQVIDLGQADAKNRAVVAVETTPAIVTIGSNVAVKARVKAFGGGYPGGRAQLVVDGRVLADETQELPAIKAGDETELEFRHQFAAMGDYLVEVRIDQDSLPVDDRRFRIVPVREAVDVLLVDGDAKPGVFQSETAFLAEALSPETDSPGQASAIRVKEVTEAQLSRGDLSGYDAIVLCNVARFSRESVEALESFVGQGGGLVFFTGDQVRPENYNSLLFKGGKGILPAEILPPIGDPASRETPFFFDPLGFRHPVLSDYAGQPEPVVASLANVKTFRYHRLNVPADSGTQTVLRLGPDPLIVEARRGRGQVLLVGTAADRDWSDWPIHQSYPVLMEKMIYEAASQRFSDRNVTFGEPIDVVLPAKAADSEVTVRWPDRSSARQADNERRSERLDLEVRDLSSFARSPVTDLAGDYQVEVGPPTSKTERFAANPPATESDLTKLDVAGLRVGLPGWSFDYDNDWKPLKKSTSSLRQRGEFHRPLLWSVLGLLLIESFLAWKFGHHRNANRS